MFIGKYEIDGQVYNNIYYNNFYGWKEWHKNTFSPTCENIEILDFTIRGKTYEERKANAEDLAKEWQLHFCQFSWSYGELAEIETFFEKVGKRYGLLKIFKENAIL